MDKKFELRTDHNGLKYLFDQPTLNARKIRWLEFLCEYDFDIKHIKGKENKVADALSKKVHELHAIAISMYQTKMKNRVYVPNIRELKLTILKEMHNMAYAGYPRYQKTVAAVKGHYFWPGMKKE